MTPNDTDETDGTNETNRTDEPTECEYCGERFDGERALYDHWYHADPRATISTTRSARFSGPSSVRTDGWPRSLRASPSAAIV